ncbi:tetratricopeptide repeat protein [Larkinella arboricola]|uniref:Tetratricopeptide repeat protein n=1 Tax=Larkinella arboricola TaxID=643671 RepID=A0A327WP65_LARAB|nr:tetratricopeptide repeat protein [Larkinella arboricola]RAJ92503.1 tetratricopeptide repeat protein [Larkinella arboricola]
MAKQKPVGSRPASRPATPSPPARQPVVAIPARSSTPDHQTAGSDRLRVRIPVWLPAVLLAVLIAFSFGFGNGFVDWDDSEYVFGNPYVLEPTADHVRTLLQSVVALNYHPLTMVSLAANSALSGPGATSFIVTNTVIHLLNTLLVFSLAYQLSRKNGWVGLFVAALWGLHPMHVESVIWVSERKDVLYTFFFLSACLTYLRYRKSGAFSWFALTFILFVLSCLSKAMAVVLPLVLLLIDYWQAGDQGIRKMTKPSVWLEKIPFLLVAVWVGLIATDVQAGGDFHGWLIRIAEKKDAVGQEPFAARWLVYGSYGFLMYLVRLVAPFRLSAFYPYPENVRNIEPHHWLGPVVFVLVVGYALWQLVSAKTERQRLVAFGIGFFLITILLVLQFMTVGAAIMADRYSYLSYFGLIFMVVYGFYLLTHQSPSHLRLATIGLGLFAVLCFYRTTQQVQVWKNTETLWTHALQFYPDNDQMREGLGDYYGKQNRIDEALQQFQAAVANGSSRYHCYEGLGNAYGLKNEFAKALEMYGQAIRLDSSKSDVYYNRGLTYNKVGRFEDALRDFNQALALAPGKDTLVLTARGFSYLQLKQYAASLADYERYLRYKPTDPTALHNRGVNRFYLGDRAGALADIRRAVLLKPDYEEARNNLRQLEQVGQ